MARGPKMHLKRLNAPKHWMLDKLGGVWAPRPSTGPHKLRECLPLLVMHCHFEGVLKVLLRELKESKQVAVRHLCLRIQHWLRQ